MGPQFVFQWVFSNWNHIIMVTLLSFALTKKSASLILLFGAFLTFTILDTCHAANTTNNEAESMEKGMDFLFQMTKGFLELIQPNRIYSKYGKFYAL